MVEDWESTPQERVLNHLYESVSGKFTPDLYGVTEKRSEAIMYITDPDGNCWEITAKPHSHEV